LGGVRKAHMTVDATAIIGLLVGFLVVGIIGTYIGDQMIAATNLTTTAQVGAVYQNPTTGLQTWTAPAGVTVVDIVVIGGGGPGGAANNGSMKGGGAGVAGTVDTQTSVTVIPGTGYQFFIGSGGFGVTAGTGSNITIGVTTYSATGGAAGTTGANTTVNGSYGLAGYTTGMTSLPTSGTGTGNATNATYGGRGVPGFGASGGGAAFAGAPGAGTNGAVKITYTSYTDESLRLASQSQLTPSMESVIATFVIGVLLCKIIVIVSIASIVFVLLQKTGLIPKFGQE